MCLGRTKSRVYVEGCNSITTVSSSDHVGRGVCSDSRSLVIQARLLNLARFLLATPLTCGNCRKKVMKDVSGCALDREHPVSNHMTLD